MSNIKHVIGDATKPEADGFKFIAHCCNNIGRWGSGFVVALSQMYGMPELMYLKAFADRPEEMRNALGQIQVVPVKKDIIVVNIIGQRGVVGPDNPKPIDYDALRTGLRKTNEVMKDKKYKNATLNVPRIGAGLARGDWDVIEKILEEEMEFPVIVYTLPHEAKKFGMKEDEG